MSDRVRPYGENVMGQLASLETDFTDGKSSQNTRVASTDQRAAMILRMRTLRGSGDRATSVRVAWVETTSGNDAVEMRMQAQVLSPAVQDAEESDPGSEMPGVGCGFNHRC
jgi:hypothetical protein